MRIHLPWTKKLEGILVAERAAGINRINRVAALNERLVKKRQDMTLGNETAEPMDKLLEEDMGVNVGDTVVNHYHPAPEVTQQQVVPQKSLPTWFLASLLVCALLGAGALAWLALKPDQPTTPQPTPVFDVIVAE